MDHREEYEQEIDLKDLMFYVLYRWRSLLLVSVLACVLAIGYVGWYNWGVLPGEQARVQRQLDEQKQMYDKLEEGQSADAIQKQISDLQTELEELAGLSFVKYGVIGFVAGLFGLAFCYALGYVLSDKMRGERELLERYGYYLLGTFPRQHKGKALGGFDRSLEKWEGVSEVAAEEETYEIISANITNLAKDGGLFLVTGTVDTEKLQGLTKAIVPLLQKNVMLAVGANMNRTASTLEALGECDAVILVEERGKSFRGMVQREHESIVALGKPVVGYVVL